MPTLLVEHRGRKSGKVFVTPLLCMLDGANVVIVASQGGRADDPPWYRNLLANPTPTSRSEPIVALCMPPRQAPTSGPDCGRFFGGRATGGPSRFLVEAGAIANGERVTGVTTMKIDDRFYQGQAEACAVGAAR